MCIMGSVTQQFFERTLCTLRSELSWFIVFSIVILPEIKESPIQEQVSTFFTLIITRLHLHAYSLTHSSLTLNHFRVLTSPEKVSSN